MDYRLNSDLSNKFNKGSFYGLREYYFTALNASCKKYDVSIVFIPYEKDLIKSYTKDIDGILIPGYLYDIDPKIYGQHLHEETKISDTKIREDFEIDLIKEFSEKDKSILGICHGMQILNVIYGGSMIQDIPSQTESKIKHSGNYEKAHEVTVDRNSKLGNAIFTENDKDFKIWTNSSHHQAVDRPGNDFKIVGKTEDGIVEAIESTRHNFIIGIQWHPEFLLTEYDSRIFDAFCKSVVKTKKQIDIDNNDPKQQTPQEDVVKSIIKPNI